MRKAEQILHQREKEKTMCDQKKAILKLDNESGKETIYYPLFYDGFPDEFKRKAKEELNETDENIKNGLQMLKEFMKRENIAFPEDYILMSVLRNCKYNLKKSEAKLKQFLKKRRDFIQKLTALDTQKIEFILDDLVFGFLPYRDKYGRPIVYTRPTGYAGNEEKYELSDVGMVAIAGVFMLMKHPVTSVCGYTYFGDCKVPYLSLFYHIMKVFKQFMFSALSFPIRVSRGEIFNENILFDYFYKLMKPILSQKIINRVSLNGHGCDNLRQNYDPDILPEEFGGNMGKLNNEFYKQKFLDFIAELKKESLS